MAGIKNAGKKGIAFALSGARASGGAGNARRGVAFALASVLLGIVLLMLASMLSEQSLRTRQAAVRLVEVDDAAEHFYNAQRQAAKIMGGSQQFAIMPDANTSMNATYLTITETLPPSQYLAGELGAYANTTANLSPYSISFNFSGLGNGTYFIRPGRGNITHPEGGMLFLPAATQAEKLKGYEITIVYLTGFPGSMQWEPGNPQPPSAGDNMSIDVRVHDSTYTVSHNITSAISKSGASVMNITDGDGNLVGKVSFGSAFGGAGAALVEYLGSNITLKTSANFTQSVYVEANASINMTSAVFNRTSLLRVA